MFAYQLRKTIKFHAHLVNCRYINKIKAEHVLNSRLLHQLNEQHFNSTEDLKDICDNKFPLRNNGKTTNSKSTQFRNCIHKPLSINLQITGANNGDRRYLEKYPSVTTILSNTKSSSEFFGLMQWRKANIQKHGKEKFSLMQRDTTRKGTHFHQEMKMHFSSVKAPPQDNKRISGFFHSVNSILANISNPLAIESAVLHSQLEYAGTVDLVAEYNGTLSVIDWKTSKKKRDTLKDCHSYPLQLAAYAGAINYDDDYPFQISNGVLVIAYENQEPADIHILDGDILEQYWDQWMHRLHKYNASTTNIIHSTSGATKSSKTTSAPAYHWNNRPYLSSLEVDYTGNKDDYASFAPNINGAKGLYIDGRQCITNGHNIKEVAFKTVQHTGRNLNELGKQVKDEEIIDSWKTLSGLIERIFGNVILSRSLMFLHYFKSIISEFLRAILKLKKW